MTTDAIGGITSYLGLRVIDVVSGRIEHIPDRAPSPLDRTAWRTYLGRVEKRVGCLPATDLDWSPDGSALAYRCGPGAHRVSPHLRTLRIGGSASKLVPTPTTAYWPSWAADGKRLAYSTTLTPKASSEIYTILLDGSERRVIARGVAPAWSPNGELIAYQATCGIRLVTPTGRDVTPTSPARPFFCGLGYSGRPTWSPDGRKLAFEARGGIWVMNADGRNLRRISKRSSWAWYGQQPGRPSWRRLS